MQNAIETDGNWISLMDYATQFGVSLSTLRRHIKASKVQFRVENGKYLLRSPFVSSDHAPVPDRPRVIPALSHASAHPSSNPSNEDLQLRLRRAQEEITELKMLVAIYEEQLSGLKESAQPR